MIEEGGGRGVCERSGGEGGAMPVKGAMTQKRTTTGKKDDDEEKDDNRARWRVGGGGGMKQPVDNNNKEYLERLTLSSAYTFFTNPSCQNSMPTT